MQNNNVAITVRNLNVAFAEKQILKDISFTAGQGEFIAIIGPNGAGKSTLLKAMRGLIPSTEGEVLFANQSIKQLADKQLARIVAYMQQEINVSFGFTALEIVLTGRYPYLSWWKDESKTDYAIARKYMELTGVSTLEKLPVQSMSGGQRQRVLLAKVLTQETPIIFLDEPTASLDLLYQEEIFNHCKNICQQGKTVFIVAHDLKLAAKFCTRLILISNGKIIADGLPENVVTTKNLEKTYGLNSAVFVNKVTGNIDIHTYVANGLQTNAKVHIIGGGGTASQILRYLHERGYTLSIGVVQQGDNDADVAAAFGVESIITMPFSEFSLVAINSNEEKIMQADLVVMTNLCFGQQNMANLRAAFRAKQLIIIEDLPIIERDFTQGEATELYGKLVRQSNVSVQTTSVFLEGISQMNRDSFQAKSANATGVTT